MLLKEQQKPKPTALELRGSGVPIGMPVGAWDLGCFPSQGAIGLEEGRQERDSFSQEKGAGRGGKCCRDAGLHLRAEIRAWLDRWDTNGAGHHASPFIVRKREV